MSLHMGAPDSNQCAFNTLLEVVLIARLRLRTGDFEEHEHDVSHSRYRYKFRLPLQLATRHQSNNSCTENSSLNKKFKCSHHVHWSGKNTPGTLREPQKTVTRDAHSQRVPIGTLDRLRQSVKAYVCESCAPLGGCGAGPVPNGSKSERVTSWDSEACDRFRGAA